MGGVPTQKQTKGKKGRRRSHHGLNPIVFSVCLKCKRAVLPHHICKYCGAYARREVIDIFGKLDKKEQKRRKKIEAEERSASTQNLSQPETVAELNPQGLSRK